MGGTITIFPNETFKTRGWSVNGAATAHAALSDSTGTTNVKDNSPGSADTLLEMGFENPTLPEGTAVKSCVLYVNADQATGENKTKARLYKKKGFRYRSPWRRFKPLLDTEPMKTFRVVAAGAVGSSLSDNATKALRVQVMQGNGGHYAGDTRLTKLWVEVNYVDAPTAADITLEPADANTRSSKPPIYWDLDSQDGIAQYEYRAAVWLGSDVTAAGGAASMAPATIFGSGAWDKTGWTQSRERSWVPGRDLIGNVEYVFFVQVRGRYAGEQIYKPSSFAYLSVTMSLAPPAAPTGTVSWDADGRRATGTVNFAAGLPSGYDAKRVNVERSHDGGATWWPIPQATTIVDSAATSLSFVDPFAKHGAMLQYRAQVDVYDSVELLHLGSAWGALTGTVQPSIDAFLLRDPRELPAGAPLRLRLLGDLQSTSREVTGEFRPLSGEFPVTASDGVTGRRWKAELLVQGQAQADLLDDLRRTRRTLILQDDMGGQFWARIGSDVQETLYRNASRTDAAERSRNVQFELVESRAPFAQPQSY